ncbi:MAG: C69 family dipeptidase [Ignavibacteriaceae bacterium]
MKRIFNLLFVWLLMFGVTFGCTNLIVTKGASSNGSTMITYSADSYETYGELVHYPAAIYPEGTMLDVYEWDTGKFLGKIKQARQTYNVVGNMNEYQVVIGETTFDGRSELHNGGGIIDYGSLIYIALQRSKTAREAIKIMGALVDEYGYYSTGESFSIGDANEAWIMELIGKGEGNKGAVWVAIRIPDGYVSGHANQARITTFDLNDSENVMYSPDVISFAKEKGFFAGEDKDFSFADAYAPVDFGGARFCDARVWSMFRKINGSMEKYIDYIEAKSTERMPLYVKPDKKISLQDVMYLMRDHYEGTPLDMTKGIAAGPYCSPYRWRPLTWKYNGEEYFHERPISTPQTGFSFVSQSRASLPDEIGGVLWFGVDDTYMTVYTPIYSSSISVPYNFKEGLGSLGNFTWDSAFWVFNFVSNMVYPKYSLMIDDVKNEQSKLEGSYLSKQEMVENTALVLYKESKGKAVEYLTKYSNDMALNTYTTWKKFGEFLMMKFMDGIVKDEYIKPINVGYPEEFKKYMVDENGEYLKMRKFETEVDFSFTRVMKEAEKALTNKNFTQSKDLYLQALKLKREDAKAKSELQKVERILTEIDKIYEMNAIN